MKNSILRRCGGLLVLTLLGATASAKELIPAKGQWAGQWVSFQYLADPATVPLGTPFLEVVQEGEGHGTGLGRYTTRSEFVISLQIVDGSLTYVSEGTWFTTAANGDTLWGTFRALTRFGEAVYTSEYVIEDGSGRFEGATGYGTSIGFFDDATNSAVQEDEGWASSVGSLRRAK